MPMCERCWTRAYDPQGGQVERYAELIKNETCTPEQQAGEHATTCPRCDRRTVHQHARACMMCGWKDGACLWQEVK